MIADIRSVIWKEWRSLTHGRSRRQLLMLGLSLVILSVWFPVQTGAEWMTGDLLPLLYAVLLPVIIVAVIVPDVFAGERERKTLATLLASRLHDRAILFGKLVVPVLLGWLGVIAVLLVGMVVANAASWGGSLRFYAPVMAFQYLGLGFLVALLAGALGVGISLRARGVQEAQQTLAMMLMLSFMILMILTYVLAELGGGIREFASRFEGVDAWLVTLVAVAILAIVDGLLLVVAERRFRRGRLIAML